MSGDQRKAEWREQVNGIMQQLLGHVQAERDRLVETSKNYEGAVLMRNPAFEALLNQLLILPVGNLEKPNHSESEPSRQEVEKLPISWLPADKDPSLKSSKSFYDEMELWFTLSGADFHGNVISRPSAIIAVPEKSRFALIHNQKMLSLLNTRGDIVATVCIDKTYDRQSSASPCKIDVNPLNPNEIICIQDDLIKTVSLTEGPLFPHELEAVVRVTNLAHPPYGLATSAEHRCLFTCVGLAIVGISLDDWSFIGRWPIYQGGNKAIVLAVKNNLLYFRGDGGMSVITVPILPGGSLKMAEFKRLEPRFSFLKGITFDAQDHLLTLDQTDYKVQVFANPDGRKKIAEFFVPDHCKPCCLSDIAVLESQNRRGEPCKVVAVTDFLRHRVFLFS